MFASESGLARVEQLYRDRRLRAQELRAEGRKVVGYFCCYPPVEMLTALDFVPYRIHGNVDHTVDVADAYLESICCSFIRSCFDLGLSGHYSFLDGIVIPHSCDTVQRVYDLWRRFCSPQLCHFLVVPHMMQPSSLLFFKDELLRLKVALEELAGKKMEDDALRKAITVHNDNRELLRQLYELRKANPPLIAGSEVLKLTAVGFGLPIAEQNELIRHVIDEVEARQRLRRDGRPRMMVYGSEIDDLVFVKLIEEVGADVVVEDTCTSTRSFWHDVPVTVDPVDGLVTRYMLGINCPRTYRPQQRPRAADLENRFGYLDRFARDFHVDGVILCVLRFCDTHELDVPDIRDYLTGRNIPTLHLEEEYRVADVGQIKTRIEAFLEML